MQNWSIHVKNAFLHCSYAAPVRVSDIDVVLVSAARATTGVDVVRAVTFCVGVAVRAVDVVRAGDAVFVGRPATVCDTLFCDVVERDVFAVRWGNTDVLAVVVFSVVVVR